jgi:hypothetical protein
VLLGCLGERGDRQLFDLGPLNLLFELLPHLFDHLSVFFDMVLNLIDVKLNQFVPLFTLSTVGSRFLPGVIMLDGV